MAGSSPTRIPRNNRATAQTHAVGNRNPVPPSPVAAPHAVVCRWRTWHILWKHQRDRIAGAGSASESRGSWRIPDCTTLGTVRSMIVGNGRRHWCWTRHCARSCKRGRILSCRLGKMASRSETQPRSLRQVSRRSPRIAAMPARPPASGLGRTAHRGCSRISGNPCIALPEGVNGCRRRHAAGACNEDGRRLLEPLQPAGRDFSDPPARLRSRCFARRSYYWRLVLRYCPARQLAGGA